MKTLETICTILIPVSVVLIAVALMLVSQSHL